MEQTGRENVHVTVPETGGYDQAFAIDYGGIAWRFNCGDWPNCNDAAIMHEDCAILDCRFRGRGIDLCTGEDEVRGAARAACKEHREQKRKYSEAVSHHRLVHSNIRFWIEIVPKGLGKEGEMEGTLSSRLTMLVLPDADGKEMRLGSLWATQPAVLVFLRHYG